MKIDFSFQSPVLTLIHWNFVHFLPFILTSFIVFFSIYREKQSLVWLQLPRSNEQDAVYIHFNGEIDLKIVLCKCASSRLCMAPPCRCPLSCTSRDLFIAIAQNIHYISQYHTIIMAEQHEGGALTLHQRRMAKNSQGEVSIVLQPFSIFPINNI